MITLRELLHGTDFKVLNAEQLSNINVLMARINVIREAWGKPMTVTSGFRTKEDHIRVYEELAAKRHQPFDPDKVPMGSAHLSGSAVDIADPDGELLAWCKENEAELEKAQLWCEEKDDQPRVHFQIYPPKSGKRFFHP